MNQFNYLTTGCFCSLKLEFIKSYKSGNAQTSQNVGKDIYNTHIFEKRCI